jgi:iron uptake system component EfeO
MARTAHAVFALALLAASAFPAVGARADNEPVDVTVTDKGCEPNALKVPPGKTLFKIRNASKRAIEWEILQGFMVVEERENIIPGFVQNLTATLQPGDYGMTCGLLSNPKGTLKVDAAAEAKP